MSYTIAKWHSTRRSPWIELTLVSGETYWIRSFTRSRFGLRMGKQQKNIGAASVLTLVEEHPEITHAIFYCFFEAGYLPGILKLLGEPTRSPQTRGIWLRSMAGRIFERTHLYWPLNGETTLQAKRRSDKEREKRHFQWVSEEMAHQRKLKQWEGLPQGLYLALRKTK